MESSIDADVLREEETVMQCYNRVAKLILVWGKLRLVSTPVAIQYSECQSSLSFHQREICIPVPSSWNSEYGPAARSKLADSSARFYSSGPVWENND